MVRETRHLWVGNLPDNIREDRIREHFKRYGRVQSVKLLPRCTEEKTGEITMACTVAFMDIKSASKAHNAELKIDDRTLNTEYYEPAAIPSAASPQNTPSPYSTSPGSTRFPNGHGSSDEHGTFPERFYDRSTPRVASEGEFIRRTGYHDTSRGRNRDRSYRNGPYNSLMDRHSRTLNSSWTYDSARYNNTTGCSQTDTGYSTTPSENSERRSSDQSSKKKTKSRSGSRSPSPSGSTSSRSPSRSRSRSSSSSSSSSTSRDTSSTSSPKSRRLASSTSANHQPVVHSDDRRPLAICVKNLPLRSSDTSLKDGLFHEYKKHGKVTWVKVVGQNSERHAIVCFKKPEDVEKALEVSYDKLFFGCKIEVAPYQGYDVEDNDLRPYEAEIDEFHPKATRTLFIGNLEKDVTASDLRKHFDQFGEIIEIDIKKQGAVSSYAFCQYSDIVSVVKAIRKMDGEHLGNNRIKLGFGKSMPYNCVWIDGVNENVNEKYLRMQFEPFGVITKVHIDREKGQALIFYEQVLNAQAAVNKMRGFSLKNTKIQVDFASRECQESFFERLEKQGTVLDRGSFEERKDSSSRSFETSYVARFTRYDTPTRPRTSSYSSRSSAAASQVTSSMQSPGTPGSVTPRGSGSRTRVARFADYYDQAVDYPDRHFRSYDEYSQGSAASHEDAYDHEYAFVHDSPTHIVDPLDSRSIQGAVDAVAPFAPPDIRNLQKERVHLLEQLEECPSSGDELMSPKKRLKLELLDPTITSDVIIEANRDHRKVMEVRRLSDANLKHHSRRPSVDSGKHSTGHDRSSSGYLPHAVCKRRKTAGSDSGSRVHHYDHSGSESVGGSRPGTPLVDERPENFQPSEPRRIPREREGPLTLPLPRFAAQVMNRGSVSVAGIKGQKDNTLSSPPPAVTSPRISNPRPPSPVHVPPPASPPPRPPSLSSNSSDSDITPPSPSLEERIRSLDEKYEKWSGSRALSAAGGDALAMLDANLEKFRLRHKLLDLDLKEVQPSEIVKSVMAKRSVFDEDLKRLENVGEKYEPKEFSLFPRATTTTTTTTATVQTSVPATPLSAPPTLKLAPVTQLPKTPTMLSPRSAGTGVQAAKGLQYPFPTHPPLLMSPVPPHPQTPPTPTPTTSTPLLAPTATSTTTTTATRGTSHGDNRLKPCASVSSDTRTSSKVNVNRNTVVSSLAPSKTSEKTNANIPNTGDINSTPSASSTSEKHNKSVREIKSSDKTSEKISYRRDSNSSSPRADIKTRRNSDTSARRIEDSEKFGDTDSSNKERAKSEESKKERLEKVRLENERLEREKSEKERIEKERLEKEKQEKERLERDRLEKERLERESELEKQRLEKERLEKERIEREKQEKERVEKEKARLEKEKLEKERAERARQEKERAERERLERERIEKENLEKERQEQERLEKERKERERREREEREKKEKEERERKEREEQQEKEKLEKLEKERKERERKEREERERKEREEKERREREDRERKEREEKERREEEERLEKERAERERLEKEKLERERKREEERARHKDDNHDRRKDDHKHRENHSETKHRENNLDKHLYDNKNTKETSKDEKSSRDSHEVFRRDSHDARSSHEKSRHHTDRDSERRKDSIKENRDNNIHEKHKNVNDIKDISSRTIIESRHMSIDLDKIRTYDVKQDPNKRKERNNSLPANIGSKRRISSHESLDSTDENKKLKLAHDHKKLSERRDSKDSSRSEERSKSKHKNNVIKSHDKHNSLKEFDEKRKERDKEREERHKKHKLEKQKSKSKSREKESRESPSLPKSPLTDKDFLARLDLKSNEELEKQHRDSKECKENKEKRKEAASTQEDKETKEKASSDDRTKKEKPPVEKQQSTEKTKSRCEVEAKSEERKKRDRIRKITNSSESDSDEPKKHSIFDIVDDEPAYISMYDKVKARSCKNMAKQEEEKRQEKIKAKFSQLKQSRAKREEKKRSTSWDEDSESDKDLSEMKTKRSKMLIDSSDDESQDRKSRKKKEMHSDSDSSAILRQVKQEHIETSEDEVKNKNIIFKKSLLARDTSEDDHKRKLQSKIKTEILSDPENTNIQGFAEIEEKPQLTKVKDELERLIKKERRNSKHQDSLTEMNAQTFGDINSLPEPKPEKFNNRHSFAENTSDEEGTENKKERSERREKKHKKKQKKQKHSISDDSCKLENVESGQCENPEKSKHHEKKKDHSKKEKRRDKTRDKSKKSKKNKSDSKSEAKREGKMENIFGSLSEDSENGVKELEQDHKSNMFLSKNSEEDALQQQSVYNSESEKEQDVKAKEKEEREREREEHKRRKEKKRRERERRLHEAAAAAAAAAAAIEQASNDNSMDYADMGKQLEENMMKDESLDVSEEVTKSEVESSNLDNPDDSFHFTEANELHEVKREKDERKEGKEKKKKRKKSKDERSKHHHHHHHHEKSKVKSPEIKEEAPPLAEIKIEIEEVKPQSQSLPTILDEHGSPPGKPVTPDFSISPATRETNPIISPIPKTPTTSKEKKRDKFIPGFGTEIDEKIHESAVKSISEFEPVVKKEETNDDDDSKTDKLSQITEEKPRVVISQEETEDAVAALLGESFGSGQFEECYNDEINSSGDQTTTLVEESNVQDDEEMRQAVQSLSATDLDVKPDTPQSEHELQIDTDTEEQEEIVVRFDQKTPDMPEFSQPPKTPDITNYFRNSEEKTAIPSPLILKTTPNIGSPPSLTPIKQQPAPVAEIRKNLDLEQKSLPMLPEQQQRSVISQPWSAEKQQEATISKSEPPAVRTEPSMPSISENAPQQSQTKAAATPTLKQYSTSPIKITESPGYPPLKTIMKPEHVKIAQLPDQPTKAQAVPLLQTASKSPSTSQLHNLPARSPVQMNKPPASIHDSGLLSPKSSSLIHNRLPITSVMVSKPLQATTVILQQSKVAHSLEPPKLVSTSDHRPQDRPRMVFQSSTIQPPQFPNFVPNQPRMMLQGNVRHLPPQGLLVPTRQLPPNSYGYLGNISHSAYSLPPVVKENVQTGLTDKMESEHLQRPAHSVPSSLSLVSSQNSSIQPIIVSTSNSQSHFSVQQSVTNEQNLKSTTPSPNIASIPSPKIFMSTSVSPKPSPVPASSPSPKPVMSMSSPKPSMPAASPKLIVPSPSPSPVPTTGLPTSTAEAHPSTGVHQLAPDNTNVEQKSSPSASAKQEIDHVNVAPEIQTSSSIIVPTLKDTVVQDSKEAPKLEIKSEVPPTKLAIEKVTEELNMFLEKESPEVKDDKEPKIDKVTPKLKIEPAESKLEKEEDTKKHIVPEKPVEPENISVIKEIEKFDEEKADTESIVSDISKERSSADILAKDDPLDTKEDSDYWSAKEVNIDSVIKTLCSADELSDHSSENGKDEWFDDNKPNESTKSEPSEKEPASPEKKAETSITEASKSDESEIHDEGLDAEEEQKETLTFRSSVRNRGGRGRGRGKNRGSSIDRSGIQTRRGKLNKETPTPVATPVKRGRGGRPRTERKTNKSESEAAPADVYEFRDESDDANKEQRPRLILTIKSPAVSSANNSQTTAIVKEVTKDGAKEIGKEQPKEVVAHSAVIKHAESKEEFTSPTTTNTRKSKRLLEKDTSRNTVDDTIEDVVKNTVQTRAAASQRRSARQAAPKQPQPVAQQETPRKSPRGRKPRRGSEATENSSSEDTPKEDIKPAPSPPKDTEKPKEAEKEAQNQSEPQKEKPHEGLKAAMLRRIKGELAGSNQHEPTNLIDPVTGELIPMRESEEGKYIPLPGTTSDDQRQVIATTKGSQPQAKVQEPVKTQPSVITQPQQATIIQQPKPQSFKAHVLSSQAAQSVVTQQMSTIQAKPLTVQHSTLQPQLVMTSKTSSPANVSKPATPVVASKTITSVLTSKPGTPVLVTKTATPIVVTKPVTPIVVSKPITPISQHLNINTSLGMGVVSSAHLSPKPNVPLTASSKSVPTQIVKPLVLSPDALSHPKQILQVSKQTQQLTKGHMVTPMVTSQTPMINTQMAHMKQHQAVMKQQQVIMGKGPIGKPAHSLHQQQILACAVPSPPLGKSQSPLSTPSRIIQGPTLAGNKGVMEPPKVDVSMANVMLGQRPKLSPQGPQQRLVSQAGIPVPGYEASLHGERSLLNRSRSPPPAHQNSPSPKGEAIAHFPPGPLRPPPDLNPAHYMHPSHVMQYQQYLRQQQLQHLTRSGGVEKVGDGQEGEEAPVTSPPLELRRPGSVGLALTGRGVAVPHSLHSPHDRATDSPQVGQVYNVHTARMQHYHSNRYYDQTEPPVPPPAHRQQTSHSTLAALGSDRGLAHMTPLGTPDRPLSGHSALSAHMGGLATPDRPLSSHVERPLSTHGLMGAGLGAAGNLMGAVARHIGADAPTSQRGLQAATPPHASQVPPQAESLFMLLKQYPCMWQGLLALKNDQAAVQMYFVSGNDDVAKCSLPKNIDGSTPPLRIFQRMRLEPPQVEGVARKMQMENEHCMLLALPCGHDHMDVLKQSTNLTSGFITYLQQKQAAGIINVAAPGTTQPAAYVVHIFPSCDFVNENLRRIAPSLLERVADIAHLLIVITTV